MGLHQMPGTRAYWENDARCPMVADNMPHNHFQTLLACLHFTDNDLSNRQAILKYVVTANKRQNCITSEKDFCYIFPER